jgi:hypothetical protein
MATTAVQPGDFAGAQPPEVATMSTNNTGAIMATAIRFRNGQAVRALAYPRCAVGVAGFDDGSVWGSSALSPPFDELKSEYRLLSIICSGPSSPPVG